MEVDWLCCSLPWNVDCPSQGRNAQGRPDSKLATTRRTRRPRNVVPLSGARTRTGDVLLQYRAVRLRDGERTPGDLGDRETTTKKPRERAPPGKSRGRGKGRSVILRPLPPLRCRWLGGTPSPLPLHDLTKNKQGLQVRERGPQPGYQHLGTHSTLPGGGKNLSSNTKHNLQQHQPPA